MITKDFVRTMARYNNWQNEGVIQLTSTMTAAERDQDRGAFFGSIQGTLSHLLWGDLIWMSRFDGGEAPPLGIPQSSDLYMDFDKWRADRVATDQRILTWADTVIPEVLKGELSWYSGALGRDVSKPMGVCVAGFFNHQTHHRGQVHAMLTAAGQKPNDTDLFIMPDSVW